MTRLFSCSACPILLLSLPALSQKAGAAPHGSNPISAAHLVHHEDHPPAAFGDLLDNSPQALLSTDEHRPEDTSTGVEASPQSHPGSEFQPRGEPGPTERPLSDSRKVGGHRGTGQRAPLHCHQNKIYYRRSNIGVWMK